MSDPAPDSGRDPAPAPPAPRSTGDELKAAAEQHRKGEVAPAEQVYRSVLAREPENVTAMQLLAMLLFQRRECAPAYELMRVALGLAPDAAGLWQNLGNMRMDDGAIEEAAQCFVAALERTAGSVEAAGLYNNLALIDRARGNPERAEAGFHHALALDPALADAYYNMSQLLYSQGRKQDATYYVQRLFTLTCKDATQRHRLAFALRRMGDTAKSIDFYRTWLEEEPGNPVALHYLAACRALPAPGRASDGYVEATFDRFAVSFDVTLAKLDYRAPELVGALLRSLYGAPARQLDVVDAGCGTGLCGLQVRDFARELVGIDLSVEMLRRAKERGIYDRLFKVELTRFLADHHERFDLAVSADTLIYFGDLEPVIAAARQALRPQGRLVFTLEALVDAGEDAYRLDDSGRYQHREAYLQAICGACRIGIESCAPCVLRNEGGVPVRGWLVSARRGD